MAEFFQPPPYVPRCGAELPAGALDVLAFCALAAAFVARVLSATRARGAALAPPVRASSGAPASGGRTRSPARVAGVVGAAAASREVPPEPDEAASSVRAMRVELAAGRAATAALQEALAAARAATLAGDASDPSAAGGCYPPMGRVRRVPLTLPAVRACGETAGEYLPALHLELYVAPPPCARRADQLAIVLYVLDATPCLFGLVASYVYAQAGYYATADDAAAEAGYRALHIVGIGYRPADFGCEPLAAFDAVALRELRRRDLPPRVHPTRVKAHAAERAPNAHAARFVGALRGAIPQAAEAALGLRHGHRAVGLSADGPGARADGGGAGARPVRRCVLGASYSASLALQLLERQVEDERWVPPPPPPRPPVVGAPSRAAQQPPSPPSPPPPRDLGAALALSLIHI